MNWEKAIRSIFVFNYSFVGKKQSLENQTFAVSLITACFCVMIFLNLYFLIGGLFSIDWPKSVFMSLLMAVFITPLFRMNICLLTDDRYLGLIEYYNSVPELTKKNYRIIGIVSLLILSVTGFLISPVIYYDLSRLHLIR